MITLDNAQHDHVRLQLYRLEWAGTEGRFCPECGGERPGDTVTTTYPDGSTSGEPTILGTPTPDKGHNPTCALAAAIIVLSPPDRVVCFCTEERVDENGNVMVGVPHGYEAGR